MKFGIREICDVVLKAKATQKVGNKIFYKNEPVCYFDTLKTSSMESASSTVYAQGGRGNARLIAWEGDRTITFNMQDALISKEGLMILSGAGLIDATDAKPIYQHVTETVDKKECTVAPTAQGGDALESIQIPLTKLPYLPVDQDENFCYVMFVKDGEILSEPYIPEHAELEANADGKYVITVTEHTNYINASPDEAEDDHGAYTLLDEDTNKTFSYSRGDRWDSVIVDYYVERTGNACQIEITPDKFGGNYYLEASTLFRQTDGQDMPAEFIIPNCKVQSNFTFSMAAEGDPSVFDFVMDAFPDYTRFDHSKKVLCAIQMFQDAGTMDLHRHSTEHEEAHEDLF